MTDARSTSNAPRDDRERASAASKPLYEAEQIVKVARGYALPEGWYFKRLIYETTDLFGTWDVVLVGQMREVEADA